MAWASVVRLPDLVTFWRVIDTAEGVNETVAVIKYLPFAVTWILSKRKTVYRPARSGHCWRFYSTVWIQSPTFHYYRGNLLLSWGQTAPHCHFQVPWLWFYFITNIMHTMQRQCMLLTFKRALCCKITIVHV